MHFEGAAADFARDASQEEPDVIPSLEKRSPRDCAVHNVVPSAFLISSVSSCHT